MGQYADLKDEDLALELFCATQDTSSGHTRTDILDEIAYRYGHFVHSELERKFGGTLSQEDREEILWGSLNQLGDSIDKYTMGPVKLRAWWCHIARNDAIDLIREKDSGKRGGGKQVLSLDQAVGDGITLVASTRDTTQENVDLAELKAALDDELTGYTAFEQDIIHSLIALAEAGKKVTQEVDRRLAGRHNSTAPTVKFLRHQLRERLWEALRKRGFSLPTLRRRS